MAVPAFLRTCAALVIALAVVACGSDPEPASDTASDSETASDTASAEPRANATSCVEDPAEGVDYFPDKVSFDYAEKAQVSYHDTYKVLDIKLSFTDEPARYVLVQCGTEPPPLDGELADAAMIEVPVQAAITTTTTNLPHFDALGAVDRLIGVGTPAFVTTASVRDAIDAGDVEGYAEADGSPQIERIVAAQPDVLTTDAFGETVLETAGRIEEAGIPVLLGADFNETSLLARSEWLKVTALLLNAEAQATETFDGIVADYEAVAEAVGDADQRPQVLSEMPFEGTWYAPGGQSVTAKAIADAGGDYVFADDDSPISLAFDLETVIDRGADADIWIAAGSVNGTIDDLVAADERFAAFEAVQAGQVWAGDAATSPDGGNARFEEAYLRADILLADLAVIFHPDLVDHDPVFYGQVPEG